jgi:hypothetical protein
MIIGTKRTRKTSQQETESAFHKSQKKSSQKKQKPFSEDCDSCLETSSMFDCSNSDEDLNSNDPERQMKMKLKELEGQIQSQQMG